jgi:hypothetical protein
MAYNEALANRIREAVGRQKSDEALQIDFCTPTAPYLLKSAST